MSKTAEPRNSSWGPPSKCSFQSPLSAKEMYLIDHEFSWLRGSFLLSAPFLLVCVCFFVFARFFLSLEPTLHRQPFIRNNGESCPLLTWFWVLTNYGGGHLHFCSSPRWCWKCVGRLIVLTAASVSVMNFSNAHASSDISLVIVTHRFGSLSLWVNSGFLKNTLSAVGIHREEVFSWIVQDSTPFPQGC